MKTVCTATCGSEGSIVIIAFEAPSKVTFRALLAMKSVISGSALIAGSFRLMRMVTGTPTVVKTRIGISAGGIEEVIV
jgi:hypothetical protein